MSIPEFQGTVPRVTQTQPDFDQNTQALLDWLVDEFVPNANETAAAMNLNATTGTSSTSNTIGTGAKTFTANTGKSWQPGMFIVIADAAAPSTNSMTAQVTSYNSGTGELVVDVKGTLGSGTKSAWTISQTMNPVPMDDSVSTATVKNEAITADKIKDEAITADKIKVGILADFTSATPDLSDILAFGDASDSNKSKKATLFDHLNAPIKLIRLNSDVAGANITTPQAIFGKGVTLPAGSVWEFESAFLLSKSAGTSNHSLRLLFGGTATLNNIMYQFIGQQATTLQTTDASPEIGVVLTAAETIVTATTTSAGISAYFVVHGTVSINAGGTFIPQYALGAAPGGAYSTIAGSYFKMRRIGDAGADVNIGGWA
jgi:hypothetical protein